MLYICINILYGLYELTFNQLFAYTLNDMKRAQHRYFKRMVTCLSRWLFRIDHSIECKDDIGHQDIILLTATHQNRLDFIFMNELLTIRFPHHIPVFVFSDYSVRVLFPFVEHLMRQMHIIVNKGCNLSIEDLKDMFFRLGFPHEKFVVVLFPEGRLFTLENHIKSTKYIRSVGTDPFDLVLAPRHKAFDAIKKTIMELVAEQTYTTCMVAGVVLHYPECEKKSFAFTNDYDMFFPPFSVTKADWTLFDATGKDIVETWRIADAILKRKTTESTIAEYKDGDFLWITSNLLYFGLPVVSLRYGLALTLVLSLLLFTSYQWHYHSVWREEDRFVAMVSYCAFFFLYRERRARTMLLLGLASHILFERFSTNKQSRLFGHAAMHAFCYMSIFAEVDVLDLF